MKIGKEQLHNIYDFIIANVASGIFQLIVLACLSIIQFLLWFGSGSVLYAILGNSRLLAVIPLIISYGTIILIYAVVWYAFWRTLFKDGIRWFYYRVIFSIIPLVLLLLMFNPTPDPMAMINIQLEPIFSCLVTAILLLPTYSIVLYKFILQSNKYKKRRIIGLCFSMLLLGSLIFILSWNFMHVVYN